MKAVVTGVLEMNHATSEGAGMRSSGRARRPSFVAVVFTAVFLITAPTATAGPLGGPSAGPTGGPGAGQQSAGPIDLPERTPAPEGVLDPTMVDPEVGGGVEAVVREADGQLVIGGDFTSVAGSSRQHVARLEPDGTLDTGFVDPAVNGRVDAVAIQADGRIVIGGAFTEVDGEPRQRVARLNADGTLDTTFGDPGVNDLVRTVIASDDGTVLIGGAFSEVGSVARNRVAQLEADGDLDTSFVDPQVSPGGFDVYAMAVEGDGQVLIGGQFMTVGGEDRSGIARLNDDGTLDESFETPGAYSVFTLALQDDGRIVIGGGFISIAGQSRWGAARLNADGSLDTTFGDPDVHQVRTLVVQDDGKVVVGGSFQNVAGQPRLRLARLNADGTLDPTLGDAQVDGGVQSFALEPDGGIVVGGYFGSLALESYGNVGRLLPVTTPPAGALDASFSGDGKVQVNPTAGDDYARDLVIQPDGRMVAVGEIGGQGGRFGILRFLPGGALDNGFSGNGWAATDFGPGWDEAHGVVLQPDGRFVVAGFTEAQGGRYAVARYLPGGTLDRSFSGDGRLTTDLGPGADGASSVALQPNGRIVVAGAASGRGGRFGIVRYHPNGALDRSFGGDGIVMTDLSSGDDFAWDVVVQPDGRIVAAGLQHGAPTTRVAAVRYLPNGALDPTFSGDGKVALDFGNGDDVATSLELRPDGTIVMAGESDREFLVVQLESNGARDQTFGLGGYMTIDFRHNTVDFAWDVALQPNGRIVAAGVGASAFALVRFTPDGFYDRAFAPFAPGPPGGRVTTDFTNRLDAALAVELQPDGRIVTAGGSAGAPGRVALARYHE